MYVKYVLYLPRYGFFMMRVNICLSHILCLILVILVILLFNLIISSGI